SGRGNSLRRSVTCRWFGSRSPCGNLSQRSDCAHKWGTILPLPAGEGRGEGKQGAGFRHRFVLRSELSPEGLAGFEPFVISSLRLSEVAHFALCPSAPSLA